MPVASTAELIGYRNGMMSTNKKKLVKLAAALALLGTASFGAMAEWTEVNRSAKRTTYVDLNTIRRSGHMAKIWTLDDENFPRASRSGATYLSSRVRNEYDCRDERARMSDLSAHTERMAKGSTVFSYSEGGEWSSVVPDSIGEAIFKIACGIK